MSEFKRELRYVVLKSKDLSRLSEEHQTRVSLFLGMLNSYLPQREYVVIESDWPEYETVWRLIQARVEGRPNEIESLRAEVSQLTVALAAEREKVKWLETSTTEAWANHVREKLAAAQLDNQKLREALGDILDTGFDVAVTPSRKRAKEALSTYTDTTALDKYVAEKVEPWKKDAQMYRKLLYAVGNKYSGETRHETALRYIRSCESMATQTTAKQEPKA